MDSRLPQTDLVISNFRVIPTSRIRAETLWIDAKAIEHVLNRRRGCNRYLTGRGGDIRGLRIAERGRVSQGRGSGTSDSALLLLLALFLPRLRWLSEVRNPSFGGSMPVIRFQAKSSAWRLERRVKALGIWPEMPL